MFIPAYQFGSFKTEKEALQSMSISQENLQHSIPATVVSGDAPKQSSAKLLIADDTFIFVYDHNDSVSVWFSDDYWECSTLEDAEEMISSVEGGIPAEYWAVFEAMPSLHP